MVSLVALAIYFVFFGVSSVAALLALAAMVVAATIADAEFLVAAIEAKVRGGAEAAAAVGALGRFLLIVTGVQS
jgi:hypothetical protein